MMNIPFYKMSGAGNDFVIIDNFKNNIKLTQKHIEKICKRGFAIGADGLMFIEKPNDKNYDFKMRYYNSDGKEAEMCGNGGRCIARFAYLKGYTAKRMKFLAKDGEHIAEIKSGINVKLKMIKPFDIKRNIKIKVNGKIISGHFANSGVPHFVVRVKNINNIDVVNFGRALRYHKFFAPKGTNVNFVKIEKNLLLLRTYERGVENETFACGTGAVATAILMGEKPPVTIKVLGGILKVYFERENDFSFNNVFLEGPATFVAEGYINKEVFL